MKNKIYLCAVTFLVFTLALFAPVKKILCEAGVLKFANIGNTIEAEKPEKDSPAARLTYLAEMGKAFLTDLYTNYLPYYNDTVMAAGDLEYALSDRFDALFFPPQPIAPSAAASVETLTGTETTEDGAADTSETGIVETVPEPAPDPNAIVSISSKHLNDTDTHRNYLLTAEYGDGRTVSALERTTLLTPEQLTDRKEACLAEMLRIVKFLSERVNVTVYVGSRFQDFPIIESVIPGSSTTAGDRDDFLEALSPYAATGYLDLDSPEKRFDKMFLTDHHWNLNGSCEGYQSIFNLLKENYYPDLGEPLNGKQYDVPGVQFYGSFARLANYYRIYDSFSFFDYGLPAHTASGGSVFEDCKNAYLAGRYDNTRGVAHYEAFYPAHTTVTYRDNPDDRNLFVIGDSFSRAVNEALASHFHTTVIRQYYQGGDVDLGKLVERYKISDVVILLYSDRLMYNLYNDFNTAQMQTP